MPTSSLAVLVPADGTASQRDEAGLVVVSGDVAHGVMSAIRCQRLVDGLGNTLHRLAILA